MVQKILDSIYVHFFGKYTLVDFADKQVPHRKCEYILDSVFPDEKTMDIALSENNIAVFK